MVTHEYPTAVVDVRVKQADGLLVELPVKVAVSDRIPKKFLVGRNFPEFSRLVDSEVDVFVTTRARASKLGELQTDISEARQFDFDDSMFSGGGKARKSRGQKRILRESQTEKRLP